MRSSIHAAVITPLLLALLGAPPAHAQDEQDEQDDEETIEAAEAASAELPPLPSTATLEVNPSELRLEVGETAQLEAVLQDREQPLDGYTVVYFSRSRRNVGVDATGKVEAYGPGEFTIVALVPRDPEDRPRSAEAMLRVEIPVTIPNPPVETVELVRLPGSFYAGTQLLLHSRVIDRSGVERSDVEVEYESSNESVAEADAFGHLLLKAPGSTTITARAEAATSTRRIDVVENPVASFELVSDFEEGELAEVRTGDVVRLSAIGRDRRGLAVEDLPVHYSVAGRPAVSIIAPGSTAMVTEDGRFVAERSGIYTVVATAGGFVAEKRIRVEPRRVRKEAQYVGQGKVRDRHTSDLWIWEGQDGRDYAITGTWGAEGHAYVWDVTNPESITLIDTVRVDARTVNDVKISEDGKLAVISREGASNRRNGIVIVDVSDPSVGVRIVGRYDDQLRGGVHNVFVHDQHVYAVNNGRRFDIINIEDPAQPYRVGRFELDTPGHAIHDVWVADGVAFTSNWGDGVWAIDVGGGGKGGAPNNPVPLGHYAYPSGWNHAAFPYRSKSTGKFYVFAGDEAFPYGLTGREANEAPPRAAGWIHVIEWEDWANPREVARYQVPEAGTHNLWIEDDVMYVAYYNGGLRVVDVSGELLGDLYAQGREIAMFMPFDGEGFIPNSPFTWGPQPYKDRIFFSDWNSGLWAIELVDPERPDRVIGEPQ
ncbi:MAG TPA: hypothetical protein VMT85_19020 [Thermoanaerobaculia bacterium]|nr:hypothetical protein [Thermoanaerobaculia bacterium]